MSCGLDKGKQSPAPSRASQDDRVEGRADSRASEALSVVESFAESLFVEDEVLDVVDDSEVAHVKWTVVKRNVRQGRIMLICTGQVL